MVFPGVGRSAAAWRGGRTTGCCCCRSCGRAIWGLRRGVGRCCKWAGGADETVVGPRFQCRRGRRSGTRLYSAVQHAILGPLRSFALVSSRVVSFRFVRWRMRWCCQAESLLAPRAVESSEAARTPLTMMLAIAAGWECTFPLSPKHTLSLLRLSRCRIPYVGMSRVLFPRACVSNPRRLSAPTHCSSAVGRPLANRAAAHQANLLSSGCHLESEVRARASARATKVSSRLWGVRGKRAVLLQLARRLLAHSCHACFKLPRSFPSYAAGRRSAGGCLVTARGTSAELFAVIPFTE